MKLPNKEYPYEVMHLNRPHSLQPSFPACGQVAYYSKIIPSPLGDPSLGPTILINIDGSDVSPLDTPRCGSCGVNFLPHTGCWVKAKTKGEEI